MVLALVIVGIIFISGCIQQPVKEPEESVQKAVCGNGICELDENKNCPGDCIDLTISWQSMNGPPGGRVTQLIQNPSMSHELYAITSKGIHKSEDKGESWQVISELENIHVSSVAAFEDKLFTCGDGAYYYDTEKNLVKILNEWCNEAIVSDNKLFVTSDDKTNVKIQYVDLALENFNWKDISPSESELRDLVLPPEDIGFGYYKKVPNIIALGNRILVNIILHVDGSGEFTNGHLYLSENLGDTWSRVDLGMSDDLIIANIVQNPNNPDHIVISFKHNIVHEFMSPISELLRESYDRGRTWSPVTDLTLQSNGITDVDIVGSSYYLLNPYGGPSILKIDGANYEYFDTPTIREFSEMSFGLDTLLFDFDNPNIVYGKTGGIWALGILKSEDGMATWKKMDGDIVASSPTIIITHPTDPNIVLTSGNVIQESYATRDWGETWEPFSPVSAGDEVRVDPHNPNHILLIDEMTNIYESYDSGRTFQRIAEEFSSAKIFDFEIAKDDPSKIYVSNIGVGISEYSGQKEWHYLTNSPDYTYDIEIDPENSNIFYATYSPKIFENHSSIWKYSKYQEENSGWSEILRVENSKGITSIRFDESNPNKIYAGVVGEEGKIYFSNDKGETWGRLNEDFFFSTIHSQNQLAIDPTDEDIIYAAPWGAGLFKTVDSGETWTEIENIPTLSIASIVVDPANPNIVYAAGRAHPYLYKSADGGQTWQNIFYAGSMYSRLFKIKLDPSDHNTIYVSAFKHNAILGSLFKISDGEATDITGSIPRAIIDIAVDPTDSDTIYVSLHGENVYKTTDGGTSWQNLDSMPIVGTFDIEIDPSNPNILYAAAIMGRRCPEELLDPRFFPDVPAEDIGTHGVYKSEDGGLTWTNINQDVISKPCRALAIHPENSMVIYAGGAGGIYLTTDGGNTWTAQNSGLDYKSTGALVVSENKIYAGTRGGGVYVGDISDADYSVSWTATDGPKPEIYNIQIMIDSTDSDVIYASSYPGGMFKTMNGGTTWKDKNFFLPSFEVDDPVRQGYYRFAIDPTDSNQLYFATYDKGIYVSNDGADSQMPLFGDNNEMRGKPVTDILIDPADSNTVYVASEEGVFVTRNGGKSWGEMNNGLETLNIRSLKIISIEWPPFEDNFEDGNTDKWEFKDDWSVIQENGNYVLQGIGHNWVNADSESWTDYTFEAKVKLIQGGVHINFRKSGEGRYFLGFNDGGLYLTRQFNKWSELAELTDTRESYNLGQWYDFRIELSGSNIKVYVDDTLKIDYIDSEPLAGGAVAFETLDDSKVYVDDVSVRKTVTTESVLYAGTGGYGIYRFNQASNEWQNLGRTFGGGFWSAWERRMYQFSSILFDSDVPGKVYYGHFPSGFFISEDNGHTWKDSSLRLGNDGMFSLSMHPHNHDILFAGTYNGIVKSVDRGRTWEMISTGMPSEQWPYTVAIDDNNTNIMYTSTKNGQNKGFCHRNDFCGVVMKSTDGGENWFRIMNGLDDRSEFYTLIIYPPDHNVLFLSTNNGVYISRDAGNSWKSIDSGLPSTNNQVRDNVADNLALTPDNRYLILGLAEYGVWKADLSNVV